MTKVEDIVKSYLVTNGYDGLYNDMGECGCTFEDFAPCEGDFSECQPGHKFDCARCKNSPANDGDCEEPGEFEDTFIICENKNACAPFHFEPIEEVAL